jgi:DNA-3-methyladenine glycosylase
LRRSELPSDAVSLARFLIGTTIVRDASQGRAVARIVETEAYVPGDAAAHSFHGETVRNRTLFGRRGHAYVYFIYGNHYCFNVSAERVGVGAGVLVRAAEPLAGIELMRERRGRMIDDRDLLRGPGRLAKGLAIDRSLDGLDLCAAGPLWLGSPLGPVRAIETSRRIGLTKEADRVLRFFESGSRFVSGPSRIA